MLTYDQIKDVHLEISSLCNAECPLCPRNFRGYKYNDGYEERNLSLEEAKRIFDTAFLKQLNRIWINGNFGDIVMNPEATDIIRYFRNQNTEMTIEVSTNGSARDKKFWQELAALNVKVKFCIDGLEDTHHLYRRNTSWNTVIKNSQTFIKAGGNAIWKFIVFDHNRHQVQQCRDLSKTLGFRRFELVDHGRNTGPVFDKQGNHLYNIGPYKGPTNFELLFHRKKTDEVLVEDISKDRTPKTSVSCFSQTYKSIYVACNGDVSPCCWTGFSPATYGRGEYMQAVNSQLAPLISKNNALKFPLKDCILWFDEIKNCWSKVNYEQGRLIVCDDNCGS